MLPVTHDNTLVPVYHLACVMVFERRLYWLNTNAHSKRLERAYRTVHRQRGRCAWLAAFFSSPPTQAADGDMRTYPTPSRAHGWRFNPLPHLLLTKDPPRLPLPQHTTPPPHPPPQLRPPPGDRCGNSTVGWAFRASRHRALLLLFIGHAGGCGPWRAL